MVRIVFAADSHLNKHYARMTPDQLAARRDRLRAAWAQSVDFALAERAHLYVHGGDLFDGPNPRAVELMWVADQIQRLTDAGTRVLLIGGNHDIPKTRHHGATPQRLFDTVRLARTFTRPTAVTWHEETIEGTRLAVGGLPPDPRLAPEDDPLALLEEPIEPPEADLALLVTHYAVEGLLHPLAEEATIRRSSIAALAGKVDLLCVGHLHEARELEIGGVNVVFPGPTERMSFGELELRCGFAFVTVEGRRPCRVRTRLIHLDPQPMRRETVRATDIPREDPTAWLVELVRRVSAADQILQLRLEGPLPRETYHALSFLAVWQVGSDLNFYFDLDRHQLSVDVGTAGAAAPGAGEATSPRAEIARIADAMAAAAADDAERELVAAARALALERYGAVGTVEEG